MPVSRANVVDIYYEKSGSGPAFVMLHPVPWDHNAWLYQVARFSPYFTTLAIDMRGFGLSAKPKDSFSARDMCDDIMGVLSDEGFTSAIIMGCSFGSKVALTLATDHPDTFNAVILAGGNSGLQPWLEPHIPAFQAAAAAGQLKEYQRDALLRGVIPEWAASALGGYLIDGFVERARGLNTECMTHVFEALVHLDLTPRLATFEVPLLIINGEYDSAFAGGARTASLVDDAIRKIIPGASHCSFLEDPARYGALVEEFLKTRSLWPEQGP